MTEIKVGQIWTCTARGLSSRDVEVIGIHDDHVWVKWPDGSMGERTVQQLKARFTLVTPFFEQGKTYRNIYTGAWVTIHRVDKLGEHRFAAGLAATGHLFLCEECDFPSWEVVSS